MKPNEREDLAQAYVNAWQAVKQEKIKVTAEPYGWFDRSQSVGCGQVMTRRVRAAELLRGLAVLTARLAKGN
jgi:hypothetical protein